VQYSYTDFTESDHVKLWWRRWAVR